MEEGEGGWGSGLFNCKEKKKNIHEFYCIDGLTVSFLFSIYKTLASFIRRLKNKAMYSEGTMSVDQFSTDRCQMVLSISNQNICRALVYQVVKNKALYFREYPYFTWYDVS